ncbi:MAG: sulfotransferase [Candidatus Scalinduaceae bacterium]
MVEPTFLLIGAQKSGTTWLSAMLTQHPEVFIPRQKELQFFNISYNYDKGIDWYRNQFSGYSGEKAVGECTPNYLWVCDGPNSLQAERKALGKPIIVFRKYPCVIRNIPELVHNHFPEQKLIVILRNPIERAISSFYHAIRSRKISPRCSLIDVGGEQGILGMSFYYRHLLEWLKFFQRERFLILIYEEDIVINKQDTIRRVFEHIEVDKSFKPQNLEARYNERSGYLFMYLNYYFPFLARRLFKRVPQLHKLNHQIKKIAHDDVRRLHHLYDAENKLLEALLGRSLAVWNRF